MNKLERLLNLTAALLETERPLTAEQLRERIPGYPEERESFRRQFERDKDDLREMGIPLQIAKVPGTWPPVEGYLVKKEDYYLRDPGLTPDELAALHLASSLVHIDGLQGLGGLWKLGGAVATAAGEAPAVVQPLPADPNLATMFSAMADRRLARFSYHGTQRELQPYRLDHHNGRWYASGFDRTRGEVRVFRLDRIEGAVTASGDAGAFERPAGSIPGLKLEPWQVGDEPPVAVRVLVDSSQAAVAVHHLGPGALEERRPDGSAVLRLEVTNRAGFRTFLMGFLDHATVLDPPEVRNEIVEWLRARAEAGR